MGAFFTGSKNAMKGFGFYLGGLLLEVLGFREALWVMAANLGAILTGVVLSLPPLMGKAKASKSAREFFTKNRGVNLPAAARVFLFGARDIWFVVGLPVLLYASGWTFTMVGGFLVLWTIGYGVIQAAAPAFVRRSADGLSAEVPAARLVHGLDCRAGDARRDADRRRAEARVVRAGGPLRLRRAVRGKLLDSLLSRACLRRKRAGGGGCRLPLCGQRRWPLRWHLLSRLLYT